MFKKFAFISFILLSYLFLSSTSVRALPAATALNVQITQINESKEVTFTDQGEMLSPDSACYQNPDCQIQTYQKLTAKVLSGEREGQEITIVNGDNPSPLKIVYQIGDQLIVDKNQGPPLADTESSTYHIEDYLRQNQIFILFIVFLIVTVIVTRTKGLKAVLGMAYSFFIIIKITLPLIMQSYPPFLVSLLTIIIILPPTFYFSHGFSRKTHAGLLGTTLAMIVTIGIAYLAVNGTKLTGYGNEESSFIAALMGNTINIQALLLAGIMIGALGTLNDVTISQAAVVVEIKKSNPQIKFKDLYLKSMNVGQDHIVSMVDTLILVYAGSSLPLLILLSDSSRSFFEVINYEIIAEEIVIMLVGSIGLILAVPITTFITCLFFDEA